MNKKDDNNFFSTEEEYNKRSVSQDRIGDYSKYLEDTDDGEYISLIDDDAPADDYPEYDDQVKVNEIKSDKEKKNKTIVKVLVGIIIALVVIAAGVVGLAYYFTHGARYNDKGVEYNDGAAFNDDEDEEEEPPEPMGDVTDADSLNSYLKTWLTNGGELMHSKDILNVLLCGVDASDDGIHSRSDSIILVSVNKKTKSITLTSFFRDSYTYMEIPQEDGTGKKGRYEKINASYFFGGPATLIDTVERNYKIKIDQYISVDFESFEDLIDALGGVTVDVKENEANYIHRTSAFDDFPSGNNVTLNGEEALVYSRIRKLDTDIHRTERQRKIIKALINSAKSASPSQLINAYKKCAKYIRTGYSQSEVIELLTIAATDNWMDFSMNEITMPSEEGVEMISSYINTTSQNQAWVWIVDFPSCAQKLQLAIYGQTNINLEQDRETALDFTKSRDIYSSEGDSSKTGSNYSSTRSYSKTSSYSSSYSSKTKYSTVSSSGSDYTGNNGQSKSQPSSSGKSDTTEKSRQSKTAASEKQSTAQAQGKAEDGE